jgi:hypothetical protein
MTDIKHVRDLTTEEQAVELARLKRGPPATDLPPLDTSVRAKDMDDQARAAWMRLHRKHFP